MDLTRLLEAVLLQTFGCTTALIIKVNHDTHYSNFFMRALQCYAIPPPQFDAPFLIYCAELVLSPLDLIVDVFERVNTILFWHQPSIVHPLKCGIA